MSKVKIGSWTRLNSKQVYDNPWLRVLHEEVINPAGNPGIYGRIEFKTVAVAIVPVDEDGNTYLVGQYRYALDAYSWELPMGGCPLGADRQHTPQLLLAAAQRELREETGFTADHWQQLMRLHTTNSVTDEEGFVFLAKGLHAGNSELEETEDISVKKLPFEQALQMVIDGEITDAISAAALLRVALLLR